MSEISQENINKTLWSAADSSRGAIDAAIFKDYILSMLFYKYLSDKHLQEVQKLKEKYGGAKDRIELKLKNSRFILPKRASFGEIYAQSGDNSIGEKINIALRKIEEANPEKLKDIFPADFNSESILGQTQQRNKMLRNLLEDFNSLDLRNVKEDILGNSYMYLIERFGSDSGKKAGEFYTPQSVAKLLAKLAMPKAGDRICDPAMGSGGLLLLAGGEVEEQGSNNYQLYGQEKTGSTFKLARMNMYLHKKDSAHLQWGDTLNEPLLIENDKLMLFDIIIANPPFSLDKWGERHLDEDKYRRFWRGMPPASKGDYAFLSHMAETAKPLKGRVAVIVPHGVLFRSGREGVIRKSFIEENILDAVIGLPSGLFQTTGIPVAVLILDKSRQSGGENEKRKDVLFIDASKEFTAAKAQNLLTQENINKIFETYKNRKEIKKYSHKATLKEIQDNNYNLNIPRYVDTFEEEKEVNIKAVQKEIETLEKELKTVNKEMNKYLKEILK